MNEAIKKFMSGTKKTKRVTEEEFEKFIKEYPRPLKKDITGIFEPPLMTFNDFSLDPFWPGSVVAYYYLNTDEFYIREFEKENGKKNT
jgi:hypothetical protein